MEKGASEKKKPSLLDSLLQCCHSHRWMPGQGELEAEEGRGVGGHFYSSTSLSNV